MSALHPECTMMQLLQMHRNAYQCITPRMHHVANASTHKADLLDAKECIRMQHVKNAAGYKMHQNATASHRKNAAAQSGSKMRYNVTDL